MSESTGHRPKTRRSIAGRVFTGLAILIVIGAAAAGGTLWYLKTWFERPGPAASEVSVQLERGLGLSAIARRLEDAGAIDSAWVFKLGVTALEQDDALKAGEFAIPARASMREIMELLVSGRSILYRLTVAEGLTVEMIAELVAADPVLTGEIETLPGEGLLLPETYLFERGTTRQQLIDRMARDKETLLNTLWEARAPDLPIATPYEAVILASIVEKETGVAHERPMVASVFVNRLRLGMKLQSDPTIIYGLTRGRPLGRGIRRSELDRETPYNTYFIDGLPPTPIANPGRAALEAVLNPPDTDYLFFVADGTGGHAFSETLAEHNRNVAEWRRIERERAP